MRSNLQLLVRGPADEAYGEATFHGISVRNIGVRGDGLIVLETWLANYPRVLSWWMRGSHLIRTLGPHERWR